MNTLWDIPDLDLDNRPSNADPSNDEEKWALIVWKALRQQRNVAQNQRTDIDANKSAIQTLGGQIQALETWKTNAAQEIMTLKTNLANAQTNVTNLTNEVATLKNQVVGNEATMAGIDGRLITTEGILSTASTSTSSGVVQVTKPKDPKMQEPAKFSGKRGQEWENFANALAVYFSGQPNTYGPDTAPFHEKRVTCVLNLFKDNALTWAYPYVDSIRSGKKHHHFHDYPAFFQNLEKVYGDHNKAQKALEKLETIQQNKRPAADFIAEFRNLVSIAGVSEFVTLYQKLRFATDNEVLNRMELYDRPQDLEEAYEQRADHQGRRSYLRSCSKRQNLPTDSSVSTLVIILIQDPGQTRIHSQHSRPHSAQEHVDPGTPQILVTSCSSSSSQGCRSQRYGDQRHHRSMETQASRVSAPSRREPLPPLRWTRPSTCRVPRQVEDRRRHLLRSHR